MALNAYTLPYSLKRLANQDPSQAALPKVAMNEAVSDVAAQEARKQAAAEAHAGNIALGERALSLKKLVSEAKTDLGNQNLQFEREQLNTAKKQANRSLFLTGAGQLVKLGGAYLAGKEADKYQVRVDAMLKKYDDALSVLKDLNAKTAANYRATAKEITPWWKRTENQW